MVLLLVGAFVTTSTADWSQATDESCPPFQVRKNKTGICTCDSYRVAFIGEMVHCRNNPYELAIQRCYCATYRHRLVFGPCQYTCSNKSFLDITVNSTALLSNAVCGPHNRQGQMCGQCKPGYAPPVYSYSLTCVNCTTSNWGKFTAVSLLPLTAFFVFVVTFRISATSPKLHGIILFSQILTCPCNMRFLELYLPLHRKFTPTLSRLTQAVISVFGVWNLNFCRLVYTPFCLHPNTNTLQVMALDYLVAVYPLLLIGLFYLLVLLYDHNARPVVFLCKPFVSFFIRFRRQWNIRSSLVDAFATFLLLSYVKILSVSMDLLTPVVLYDQHSQPLPQLYLFNQGDTAFFSRRHLPYAFLALFFLLTFTLLPMTLLFLYPCSCFQVCLNRSGLSCHSLHIFMDSFQGHYKNGTNDTHDFRYFSALYLLLRALVYVSSMLAYQILSYAFTTIVLICFTIILSLAQPYKSYSYTLNDAFYLTAILLLYITLMPLSFYQEKSFFSIINFVLCFTIFSVLFFQWMKPHKLVMWFSTRVLRKMKSSSQHFLPLYSNVQQ